MGKRALLGFAVAFLLPLALCGLFCYLFVNDGDNKGFQSRKLGYESFSRADYAVKGFDFSHHNGKIDWTKVKASKENHNVQFVVFKATEGRSLHDQHYKRNHTNAKAHGFVCGAYHFFIPWVPSKLQAENFSSFASLGPGDLPPIVDVEIESKVMSKHRYQETLLKLLQRLEKHYGAKPIIYTTPKMYERYCACVEFASYPVWIASYRKTLRFADNWLFWQYTENGKVAGVEGRVDVNVFNHKRCGSLQQVVIGLEKGKR